MKKNLLSTICSSLLVTLGFSQTQLININKTKLSSNPSGLIEFNNKIYFSAENGDKRGFELMEYDKTKPLGSRVTLVKDIRLGSQSSTPRGFYAGNGNLYFTANGANGPRIFTYDGSSEPVEISSASDPITNQNSIVAYKGKIYYGVNGGLRAYTNATTPTETINVVPGSVVTSLTVYKDTLYFVAGTSTNSTGETQLWKYDGTNTPEEIAGTVSTSPSGKISSLVVFDNKLYFPYSSNGSNKELYSYDGSSVNLVADVNADTTSSSNPSDFTLYNNKMYFKTANLPGLGVRVYEYDGVNAPVDIIGSGSLNIFDLIVFDNKLFFTKLNGGNIELFSYDGTSVSTKIDLNGFTNPSELAVCGSTLYFRSFNENFGSELAQYNGTQASIAEDIKPGDMDSNPSSFTEFKDKLYFSANGSLHRFDGNEVLPYTALFPLINNTNGFSIVFKDSLFFGVSGALYKTDGVSAPEEIDGPDATFNFRDPAVVGNKLYFNGRSMDTGEELYVYDGNAISVVEDLVTGSANFVPRNLTPVNGNLFFTRLNDEIWVLANDGIVFKLPVSKEYSDPESFTAYKNKLYFSAKVDFTVSFGGMTQTQNRRVLMVVNGTSAPEVAQDRIFEITDIGTYKNDLVFEGIEFTGPFDPAVTSLYFYNGSSFSETLIIGESSNDVRVTNGYTEVNDTLYFAGSSNVGSELWSYVSGGEPELVEDILPLGGNSSPQDLYDFNGSLVFRGNTENKGRELYQLGGNPLNGLFDFSSLNVNKKSLKIYPNPAKTYIYTEVGAIEILNTSGSVVLNTVSQGIVDTSNLESGIYIVLQNGKRAKLVVR